MSTSSIQPAPSQRPERVIGRKRAFIGQFITKPTVIGAIAPSSRRLSERMLEGIDLEHATAILEFGPGTGAVTDVVLPRLGRHTRFVAIELNPVMADSFRRRYPGVRLRQESVENARRICDEEGIDTVDAVVSGLPWSTFTDALQDRILDAMLDVLKPGGTFVTFAYHVGVWLPSGRRIRRKLLDRFSSVEKSRSVWRNLPPAFVYRCRK